VGSFSVNGSPVWNRRRYHQCPGDRHRPYRSIREWIAAPGRDSLVRGSRRGQEGTEDQALPGL